MGKEIFYYDDYVNNEELNARVYSGGTDIPNLLFKGFILSENLQASIKNNWGKQSGFIPEILSKGRDVAQNITNDLRSIDQLSGGRIGEYTGTTDSLNAKYVAVSDFYKSFNGTDISFPGLEVLWYLITDTSDIDIVSIFITQLKKFVGNFTITNETGGLSGKITAPNGFSMPLTFNSDINGSYTIMTKSSVYRNLLCTEVDYDISPQRTQNNKPSYIVSSFKFIPGSIVTLENLISNHIK